MVILNRSGNTGDIVLVPIFTYALIYLVKDKGETVFLRIINMLGKYSVYIWLIHGFFIYYYWKDFISLPKIGPLIYVFTLFICIMVSGLFQFIFNLFKGKEKKNIK